MADARSMFAWSQPKRYPHVGEVAVGVRRRGRDRWVIVSQTCNDGPPIWTADPEALALADAVVRDGARAEPFLDWCQERGLLKVMH